jgi:hypothetical protein
MVKKYIRDLKGRVKKQCVILTRKEIILVSVLAIVIALFGVSIFFSLKQFDCRVLFLWFFMFVLYKMVTIRWAWEFYFRNDKSDEL